MLSSCNSGAPPASDAAVGPTARMLTGVRYNISVLQVDKAKSGKWIGTLAEHGLANVDVCMTIMNADYKMPGFKEAVEKAGFSWIFHGSAWQGHHNVPPEFKGAILLHTKAAAAKSTIGSILTALGVNHVFHDKVHVHPLYLHPVVVPTLLQQLGVEWETVLKWREANLTPEQLSPKRKSYPNCERDSFSSSENTTEERHVHMAARVEPQTARGSEVSALLERLQALDAKVASLQGAAAPSNSAGAGSSNSALAVVVTAPQAAVPATSAAPAAPSPPVGLARAGSKRPRD